MIAMPPRKWRRGATHGGAAMMMSSAAVLPSRSTITGLTLAASGIEHSQSDKGSMIARAFRPTVLIANDMKYTVAERVTSASSVELARVGYAK